MKFVDPLKVLRLGQDHDIGIAASSHEREGAKEMPFGEVLASGDEFALVLSTLVIVESPPGRIDFEEGVLDEVANGHRDLILARGAACAAPPAGACARRARGACAAGKIT